MLLPRQRIVQQRENVMSRGLAAAADTTANGRSRCSRQLYRQRQRRFIRY
jgi:hypothetical protein